MAGGQRPPVREADRDRLLALLREHFARGELDAAELDRRAGLVLTATYLEEAAPAVADLPPLAEQQAGPPQSTGRRHGHGQAEEPAAGWIPTAERFRDPTTRRVMRVWIDPADHSRHYVPEPEA